MAVYEELVEIESEAYEVSLIGFEARI